MWMDGSVIMLLAKIMISASLTIVRIRPAKTIQIPATTILMDTSVLGWNANLALIVGTSIAAMVNVKSGTWNAPMSIKDGTVTTPHVIPTLIVTHTTVSMESAETTSMIAPILTLAFIATARPALVTQIAIVIIARVLCVWSSLNHAPTQLLGTIVQAILVKKISNVIQPTAKQDNALMELRTQTLLLEESSF
jgi:hypothetical protein